MNTKFLVKRRAKQFRCVKLEKRYAKQTSCHVYFITELLDTRGVFTVTVYPKTIGSNELADSDDNSIGIVCNRNCQTIEWFKDNRRITNTGPRLTLNTTEDAGVYTIRRRNRAMKHWFVQIEVIVASKYKEKYLHLKITSIFPTQCSLCRPLLLFRMLSHQKAVPSKIF